MDSKLFCFCACLAILVIWTNGGVAWPVQQKKEYQNYYISDSYSCSNLTCGGDGFYVFRHCDYFLYDCPPNRKSCQLTPECIETTGVTCANADCFRGQCYLTRNCDKRSPSCRPDVHCNPFNDNN